MNKNRFKLLSIMLSYVFFIFVIIISINAVVPEKDLQVLEPKEILVKKVDNNFSRDKNSVYEILEKDNHETEKSMRFEEEKSNTKTAWKQFEIARQHSALPLRVMVLATNLSV